MGNTSENSSRVSRIIAAIALLALLVAGTFYVFPNLWNRAAKNPRVAGTTQTSAPPVAIHSDLPGKTSPIISTKPTSPSRQKPRSIPLTAALQQIPASSAPNKLNVPAAKSKQPAAANTDFSLQPDNGIHDDEGGETGEDPRLRADYFYRQRAYPYDQTPAGARQQSLQQLDAMVTQQRAMGILPALDAAAPNSVGFPGPSNWINLGPQPVTNSAGGANFGNPASTGRVTAIAVDPTTTNTASQIVYLGAATGGVWKSTDGGASWNTIFDQNNSLAIGGIAIAPSSNTTIYVGTGELNFSGDSYYGAGVYKSLDGGSTWTQQCGGASVNFCTPTFSGAFQGGGFFVGEIAVNPTNANIALAAVRDAGNSNLSGIYRTTDGGANWALIASASGAAGNSIAWNPTDNTIVYASLGEAGQTASFGIYKSSDSGVTFTKLTGSAANIPTSNIGRHSIAVAPSNGSVVYVAISNLSSSGLLGLAKSTDAGVTWTFTLPSTLPNLPNFCSGQCWYDMSIAVLPSDPNTVVVGGSAFTNNSSTDFRSTDGGTTWTDITSGSTAVRPHVDTHVMKFATTAGGFRLYTGNDGGIWFSDNPTAAPVTWQPGNNANLTITQFYPGHAIHPSDENISFGGTQDNGTEKYSGIPAWDHVTCGDGAWAAIDPVFPTTVYANCQNVALLRSDFDGTAGTWFNITNQIPSSGERSLFIPPLVQDQNQSGRVYFGTFRVWQSMDYGNDWSVISPDLTSSANNEVTSISVAQSNDNVAYATTTDGRVWRTTNAGAGTAATWTNLTKAPLPNRYATMVRTDFGNSDIAYLSYSGFNGFAGDTVGHIFKTVDGGTTWTDISGTSTGALPNTPVNDIVVAHIPAPLNFDALFIGTDVGVFECADPASATPCQTWTLVGTGLPKVPVVGLAWRQASATLRAITHGRGVWVIETPGVNPAGLLLLSSITPSSKPAGAAAFTMTLDGNDFGQPSGTPQILVDGVAAGVTNVVINSANEITATIPTSVMAAPGLHQISVSQPGHAANPSNPTGGMTFSVTGLAPTLSLISPNSAAVGAGSLSMTVTGNNFVCTAAPSGSVVQFGSNTLVPTACSTTSLTVTVPANFLNTPSSFAVRVFSAGPGGGTSGTQTFTVGTAAANDNFVNAINIGTVPFTNSQNTTTATTEVGEPIPSAICTTGESASTHSIWYKYTPATSGNANFTTNGESIDGIIQVVTGTLSAFSPVTNGCNDNNVGVPENVTVAVTAGTTYFIMVSDFAGTGGTSVLNLVSGPAPSTGGVSDMTVAKSHTGTFNQGQVGFTYAITASNIGTGATTGTVTVIDTLPTGLTATAIAGTGWTCTLATLTCTRTDSLAGSSSYPVITLTVSAANNAPATVTNTVTVSGGGETNTSNDTATDPTTITPTPDLTVSSTHVGNFDQGEVGASYSLFVTNPSNAFSNGTVTVIDTLPASLTATAMSGQFWNCVVATLTCTNTNILTPNGGFPPIVLTVNVSGSAPATVTNSVTVSGGGELNTSNDTGTDLTTIGPAAPDMTITDSHAGNFVQGQVGAIYTLTATNSGPLPTTGAIVTVVDTLPVGLTATAITGTGWGCTLGTLTCTRSDVLAGASSYPPITLTVTVAANAPATVTDSAVVSGGGETNATNDSASNSTTIIPVADLTITKSHTGNFVQGQVGATFTITGSNLTAGPTSGTVSVVDTLPAGLTATAMSGSGWVCTVATVTCTRADNLTGPASYSPITLTVNVANNAAASLTNTVTISGGGEIITTNDSATDTVTVLTPAAASLSVSTLAFTNQSVNTTSATKSITVTNTGGAPLTITTGPVITSTNAANFAVAAGTSCINGEIFAAGATCVINVTFTPTSTGSFGPATLTLTDNASPTTQTATLTGTGIDFAVSAPTAPVSVTAGQTGTFAITATPGTGGFANSITFSASGLPAASTATFNPTSLTPGATAATTTLSISTTAHGSLPPSTPRVPRIPLQFALWSFALAAILLTTILLAKTQRQRRYTPAIFVTVALLLAITIAGCGSNTPPPTGTPAGTSTITVTATSGTLVHTTTVTLTVQ